MTLKRIIAGLALLVLLGIFFMTFSSNPYVDFATTDSAVFNYIGTAMHRGVVPYRDVFDHKGLLIYVINWLGSFISPGLLGVWLIECLTASLSLYVIWRFVMDSFDGKIAYLVLFPYVALFALFNNAGNFTETYAHLMIILVLLWLMHAVKEDRSMTRTESFFSGCCFSGILLLRPNMGIIALVVAVYFIDISVRQKDFLNLIINSLFVFWGMIVFALPFVLYLVLHDALLACIDCYWFYNLKYATGSSDAGDSCYLLVTVLLMILGFMPCCSKAWRRPALYNLIFIVLTSVALWLKPTYKHYFLVVVPGLILPLAWLLSKSASHRFMQTIGAAFCILIGFLGVSKEAAQSNYDVSGIVKHMKSTHALPDLNQYKDSARYSFVDSFKTKMNQDGSVIVVGNDCEVYRHGDWSSKSYYVFLPDSYDDDSHSKIANELSLAKDEYAISNKKYAKDRHIDLIRVKYRQVYLYGDYVLWERR